MNKKNKKEQTELSYYGLYLLNYLKENRFEQANDAAFIKGRADSAAETYERARLEGSLIILFNYLIVSLLITSIKVNRTTIDQHW